MDKKWTRIELSADEFGQIWQLMCALLPHHNFDVTATFCEAVSRRNMLLASAGTTPDGLLIGPPVYRQQRIVRDPGGKWVLLQEE